MRSNQEVTQNEKTREWSFLEKASRILYPILILLISVWSSLQSSEDIVIANILRIVSSVGPLIAALISVPLWGQLLLTKPLVSEVKHEA
jgi:hypothetical protein